MFCYSKDGVEEATVRILGEIADADCEVTSMIIHFILTMYGFVSTPI